MKTVIKPIYFIIGAALVLSSCSNDEDILGRTDGESNQIVFRTSLPMLTSRATVVTMDNLSHFCVSAFDFDDPTKVTEGVMQPIFDNVKITTSPGRDTYTSPLCRWPDVTKESHKVSFFGFSPGPDDVDGAHLFNLSTETTLNYKMTGFRVAKEIAEQVDFVTAYASGTMADNLFSGIELSFAHQLSRIEIKAYGSHKSCDIEIAGVRIGGIGVEGTFDFRPIDGGGAWSTPARGIVEYIYRKGDVIFSCGKNHRVSIDNAVSIMGAKRPDKNENCAMLIPSTYAQWDTISDRHNAENKMYISVLLRVTDATPTAGINPVEKQRYPYRDLSQGADALKIPVVYLAVKKATGEVSTRVYSDGSGYFTDPGCTVSYNLPDTEEVKEFGWAALPVKGTWAPGNIYTYSLNYTYGVGLHDPEVTTTSPGAGDAVISDKVGMTYTVRKWKVGGGAEFEVPGS